jgi:hypothetical protein
MANVKTTQKDRLQSKDKEMTQEETAAKNRVLDSALSLSRSLMTEELYMSQLDLDHLPAAMGDTLFLQLSHVKKLACMRNNFTGLLSSKVPQVIHTVSVSVSLCHSLSVSLLVPRPSSPPPDVSISSAQS